jgi:hypothetical protein
MRTVEAAHIGVVGGGGDAAVGGKPGEDEGFHLQMAEQDFKRGHVEGRVHRLEDEVVFTVGEERSHELRAFSFETAAHEDFLFAAPIAKIVVYV